MWDTDFNLKTHVPPSITSSFLGASYIQETIKETQEHLPAASKAVSSIAFQFSEPILVCIFWEPLTIASEEILALISNQGH